jgi:hypothetical protein
VVHHILAARPSGSRVRGRRGRGNRDEDLDARLR